MNKNEATTRTCIQRSQWTTLECTEYSRINSNTISQFLSTLPSEHNAELPVIGLAAGDPTRFGNLNTDPAVITSLQDALLSGNANGYAMSNGCEPARVALASYISKKHNVKLPPQDVILTAGCAGALHIAITTLVERGGNILVPSPGFPLFRAIAQSFDIECRSYRCLPEQNWECDLENMESLIDSRTGAIIVCNPSNPCGSVYSKKHLEAILNIAERNKVPIISDETYHTMVFSADTFHSIAYLSEHVPVIVCNSLSKSHLIPGWRLGWLEVHDRHEVFEPKVKKGMMSVTQKIMGPCSLVQRALPAILNTTPRHFFEDINHILHKNAEKCSELLSTVDGLIPHTPHGTIFMMIGIEMSKFSNFADENEFVRNVYTEQSLVCLPSTLFDYRNCMRIIISIPEELLLEVCGRLKNFCAKHRTVT